jgi:hypothetical protein
MVKQLFAILLSISLVLQPNFALLVFAEGAEGGAEMPTPTPTVTIETTPTESPEPTPTSEPTPTATPVPLDGSSSTLTTGDAEASAETQTTINHKESCPSGEIEVGDCGGTGTADCSTSQESSAEATSSAQSAATSGENGSVNPGGTAEIDAGSATTSATVVDDLNTNITKLTPTEEGTDSSGEGAEISHKNDAQLESAAGAGSTSGGNTAAGGAGAKVETSSSYASANIFDLVNTNIVGSNFELLFKDIENQQGDINLNELWKALVAERGDEPSAMLFSNFALLVANLNQAKINEEINATATSGNNSAQSQSGPAEVISGDSFASANLFRLVNTNIIGSDFLVAVLNIFGSLAGNIIVPNEERFLEGTESSGNLPPLVLVNNNSAKINDTVAAYANSGDNLSQTSGNQKTQSGEAVAQANAINFVNTNIQESNWYWLFLNNFGDWQGQISGWQEASSAQNPQNGAAQLMINGQPAASGAQAESQGSGEGPSLVVNNQNQAEVAGNVSALAQSGGNKAQSQTGDTVIKTGRSVALANLFSLVNTNILGGHFILPVINVFGSWAGNLVFAHPDLTVGLSDGLERVYPEDIIDYTLAYTNRGYEEARNASLTFNFPPGISYLLTKNGPQPEINGSSLTYPLGTVAPGAGDSFIIEVQVDGDFVTKNGYHSQKEKPNLFSLILSRIISPVSAAENGTEYEISLTAQAVSPDADADPDNNFAVSRTKVFIADSQDDDIDNAAENNETQKQEAGGPDTRLPSFVISSWNNVNEFIYPGDTVTFEVKLANKGDVISKETVIHQEITNGEPWPIASSDFPIGDLETGKTANLSFGLKIPEVALAGFYHSIIWATGRAPGGSEVTSDNSRTDFEIRLKWIGIIKGVSAAEPVGAGEVAAASETTCPSCNEGKDYLPYILLLLVTSLWFTDRFRRGKYAAEMSNALKSLGKRIKKA